MEIHENKSFLWTIYSDMKRLYVSKKYTDKEMEKMENTFVLRSKIDHIFHENIDIYTEDGRLLIKFRKNVLPKKDTVRFFDATHEFTHKAVTGNRGSATGSTKKNVRDNPRVKSAILGYFDRWAPKQKLQIKHSALNSLLEARETRFSIENPEKFKKTFPLVQRINEQYKKLLPDYFKKQNKKAKKTAFKIPKTSFTTITTNINFQTSIHKDTGDDGEGFGNLVVIERGRYEGGETCLPQYGVGVDVREGDVLFMDVHEWHGNLPIVSKEKSSIRMSVVCYLRTKLWERTKNMTVKNKKAHLDMVQQIKEEYQKNKTKKYKTGK